MEKINGDPARYSGVQRIGGRKFAYLIILTIVLAGFIAAVIFGGETDMTVKLLSDFFTIYMFIVLSIVAANVVEKIPIGFGKK